MGVILTTYDTGLILQVEGLQENHQKDPSHGAKHHAGTFFVSKGNLGRFFWRL